MIKISSQGKMEVDAVLCPQTEHIQQGTTGSEGATLRFEQGDDVDQTALILVLGQLFGTFGFR